MAGGARTNAKEPAAALLATGRTITDTAKTVGVSERQVSRWLREPAFRERVRELQNTALEQAIATLRSGLTEAADTIRDLLAHHDGKVRLRAADCLMKHTFKAFELMSLKDEIYELQERMARLKEGETERKASRPGAETTERSRSEGT